MSRLIDADKLKEDIAKGDIVIDEEVLKCETIHDMLLYLLKKVDDLMIANIDAQPTIQPQGYDKKRLLEGLGKLNQWTQFAEHWFKVDEVYALIKSQPTTDSWIPVSSGKLPKEEDYSEDGFVLVQTGGGIIYKGCYEIENGFWVDETGFKFTYLPIAWQPLPQPYKENNNE